jgi:hypothetical protein
VTGRQQVGLGTFDLGRKMLWPKNILVEKDFGRKIFWPNKIFAEKISAEKYFGQKRFWPKRIRL